MKRINKILLISGMIMLFAASAFANCGGCNGNQPSMHEETDRYTGIVNQVADGYHLEYDDNNQSYIARD